MKAVFLDTSAAVKLYIPEVGSAGLRAFIADAAHLAVSILTAVEFASALMRRRREGVLSDADLSIAQSSFDADMARYTVGALDDLLAREARDVLLRQARFDLRTLDALQVASALRFVKAFPGRWFFATSDRHLTVAAPAEGLTVVDPLTLPTPA